MGRNKRWLLGVGLAGLLAVPLVAQSVPITGQGTWESTLEGRDLDGDAATFEAYYDTILDITWLADGNYARTSGFDTDGRMTWDVANDWATGLDVNGITGWRLPTVAPVNGTSFVRVFSNNGTTDAGTAKTTTDGTDGGWRDSDGNPISEMGHMYYVSLGNLGVCTPNDASPGSCVNQTDFGLSNTGPFTNIQSFFYWFGVEFNATNAMRLDFRNGGLDRNAKSNVYFAWAVRPGDVTAAVPEPGTLALFGMGLLGLLGLGRARRPLRLRLFD